VSATVVLALWLIPVTATAPPRWVGIGHHAKFGSSSSKCSVYSEHIKFILWTPALNCHKWSSYRIL